MITMRRSSSAVSSNRTWLTICGFTALFVVAVEAEDSFRLQDVGIPSASDYQGVALGDATDEIYLYLSRDKEQGQLYRWQGQRAARVDLVDLENPGSEAGAGWADYGSDGDLDLFVSRVGLPDLLYLNDDGVFSEQATSLGVDDSGSGQGVSWVDYDQDGYVDLYVARFGQPNLLYAGQAGNEPFVEQGAEVGLADPGPSTGGVWGDFDADGDLDLYVVNHKRADHLYRHIDGHFFERSDLAEDDGAGVGATWVDWDNDGDLDLSLARYGEPDRLLQNEGPAGGFRFTDIAPEVRLDDRGQGQMVAWGDYDLDGDPDAYVVNGGEARDVSRLYHNDHRSFSNASIETGLTDPTKGAARIGKAAIWWDHDGDGDLDLLTIARGEGTGLFENDGLRGKNGWLKVRVRNQDPGDLNWLPLRVTVHSNERSTDLSMIAPTSYLSQGARVAVVGLGADKVDSVVVGRKSEPLVQRRQKTRTTLEISRKEPDSGDSFGPGSAYAVSAEEIDFGEVSMGLEVSRLLYVENNGETVLTIHSEEFLGGPPDGQSFSVVGLPIVIEPGQKDSVTVLFHCNREGIATADLLLHADHALPHVTLIGKNAGPGTVSVSPPYISLVPGERKKLQIENHWTSAITDVRVLAPEGIADDWQDYTVIEAGAKSTFDITILKFSRRFTGRLTVEFSAPDGSIQQKFVTIKLQSGPDMGGWIQADNLDYGLVGVFLLVILAIAK
jgi:hypothetical protein